MTTVAINDKYVEVLSTFGDLHEAIDLALRRYTIEQITTKVTELRQKKTIWSDKKGNYAELFPELRPYSSTGEISQVQLLAVLEAIFEELHFPA